MLDFINNNAVLATGIFSITSALITALIAAIVALIIDKRKSKADSIKALQKEIADLKVQLAIAQGELAKYTSIEKQEEHIDKRSGAIYDQILPNGNRRQICGYCWEKDHLTIPLAVDMMEDDYSHLQYFLGHCECCGKNCIENIEPEPPSSSDSTELLDGVELPF